MLVFVSLSKRGTFVVVVVAVVVVVCYNIIISTRTTTFKLIDSNAHSENIVLHVLDLSFEQIILVFGLYFVRYYAAQSM